MKRTALILLFSALLFAGCGKVANTPVQKEQSRQTAPSPTPIEVQQNTQTTQGGIMDVSIAKEAVLKTSKGDIVLELYPSDAPSTVKNFLEKTKSGYYTNLTFHRVESWVIQGGDPLGNGTGGGKMPTELNNKVFTVGSLGVARGGDINVSNDSQFFICTDDCSWLTGQYTNFGKVVKGMDVAKKVVIGDKILGVTYK